MAIVPATKKYVQLPSVETRQPVGESMLQGMGGSVNFLLNSTEFQHTFKLNGPYKSANGKTYVDGTFIFDYAAEIYEVIMYNFIPGLSGFTEMDILYSGGTGSPFGSILSVKPEISFNDPHPSYVKIGDSRPTVQAPVLSINPFPVTAGAWLRLDITNTQGSGCKNAGIIIKWRPI